MSVYDTYEVVVGLEVHVQLNTASKLFCGCSTAFGAPPNTQTCAVCQGHPGVLPVLNRSAVDAALRLGLALECTINRTTSFARKQYFYPDLPKGYQVSQHQWPICEGGQVRFALEDGTVRTVPLVRIHMEEDAGKSVHPPGAAYTDVDFNRAGVPLLEVVSQPAIASAPEAAAYLKALRGVVVALGISDGNMQEGSLRCDANVSVRKRGATALGTRVELKNINSFRYVQMGVEHEFRRQVDLLEDGGTVVQQTRSYDPDEDVSRPLRSKEDAHDYRYLEDPDLPPLVIDQPWLDAVAATACELPLDRAHRFAAQWSIPAADARTLNDEQAVADYLEAAVAAWADNPRALANWVVNEVLRDVKDNPAAIVDFAVTPQALASVVARVEQRSITGRQAKELYAFLRDHKRTDVDAVVAEQGMNVVRDEGALTAVVDGLLAAHPKEAEKLKAGKGNVMGFFVGQVMKQMAGKADPKSVQELIRSRLGL